MLRVSQFDLMILAGQGNADAATASEEAANPRVKGEAPGFSVACNIP